MTCKPTILDKRLGTYLHLRRFLQPHMPLPTPACNVDQGSKLRLYWAHLRIKISLLRLKFLHW